MSNAPLSVTALQNSRDTFGYPTDLTQPSPIQSGLGPSNVASWAVQSGAYQFGNTLDLGCGQSQLGPGQFVGGQMQRGGAPQQPMKVGFRTVKLAQLVKPLGAPSLVDPTAGGIAIWAGDVLRQRGYKCLKRVEVLDERVKSLVPKPHIANVYIWVKISLTLNQMQRILELSPNFLYDQQKKLLIVRSKCLNSAIALAALVAQYSKGKLSIDQVMTNDLFRR